MSNYYSPTPQPDCERAARPHNILALRSSTRALPSNHAARGFTLIETVVAIGLVSAALAGPVSAIISALPRSIASKQKLTALYLAQEGIELVREIRDNNIICDFLDGNPGGSHQWNFNPSAPPGTMGNGTGQIVSVESGAYDNMACGGTVLQSPALHSQYNDELWFNSTTGIFGYGAPPQEPSGFRRSVIIRSGSAIATAPTPPAVNPPDPEMSDSNQMDIISTVTWTDHGATKSVELRERLYNWR